MDGLLVAQSVATNICHEMANYMSIIKFLQEDILDEIKNGSNSVDSMNQLFDNVENAILSMDFFRNLYSSSESKNEISKIILKICEKKGLKISNFTEQLQDPLFSANVEKAASAILFLITKMNNSKFCITLSIVDKAIIIDVRGCAGEAQRHFIKMISTDINSENKNTFNIVAHYARILLSLDKLTIKTDNKIVDTLRIKICK